MAEIIQDKLNRAVNLRVDDFIERHNDGEFFKLEDVCRFCEAISYDARKVVSDKLRYEMKTGKLEKSEHLYRYINKDIKYIPWYIGGMGETTFDITYPSTHLSTDLSYFSFQDSIRISPGTAAVVAGSTNSGKSIFARNLVADNCDKDYKVRYIVSQTSGPAFARYISNMTWFNPMKDATTPKFDLVERYEDFQDVILEGGLNIVDWLDADKVEYYKIGALIKAMQVKVGDGMLWVMIQKNANAEWGDGGIKSAKWADLYIDLDSNAEKKFNLLTLKKVKEWTGSIDPNGKQYGFEIINYGSQFANIREVKKCNKCWGSGRIGNNECMNCQGIGYLDGFTARKATPKQMEVDF